MIMKVIRASVFLGAILLGMAAVATVSAWSDKYTGLHETAIPHDEVVWDQRAWVYWRNHTESSVELNYTSQRVRYVSGDSGSATFTAHHEVMDSYSHVYVKDDASQFKLSTGKTWRHKWKYGGGTEDDQYITVLKANGSAAASMQSKLDEFFRLTQEIWFYNDDDGEPAICMIRHPYVLQTITGPPSDCPS